MITCYLRYVIDPHKVAQFEAYAKKWLPLVERFGGIHHGYFLPQEGANNIAVALFSFPNLATYEKYRLKSQSDPDCSAAYDFERKNRSIISYERSFMRPVFPPKNDRVKQRRNSRLVKT
jgi:antibiotic biosynthesis monooxygenase (ABM) superfamily enzyme